MIPVRGIVRGIGAELRAIAGVLPLTRGPLWVAILTMPLVALAGVLLDGFVPPEAAVAIQGAALLLFFVVGLFSGRVARVVRRRRWVRYPQGPAVHPYLPQLVAFLAGGPFFLAMGGLFLLVGRHFPEYLAVAGPEDAARRVLDQILHGGLFFDALEIYHFAVAPKPTHWTGQTLLFVTRFCMDLVFVKLLIQILRAALHRARDLGRGEDLLMQVHRELAEGDEARVTALAQACGDSLRDAVDDLIRQGSATDPESPPGQCLLAMGEFAIPYLRAQAQWRTGTARADLEAAAARLETTRDELNAAVDECLRSTGDFRQTPGWATLVRRRVVAQPFAEDRLASASATERESLGRLVRALGATDPSASGARTAGRFLVLVVLWAILVAAAAVPFVVDGEAALVSSGMVVALLGALIVFARSQIVWLVRRGVLRPVSPKRLPWVVAVWTLALAPLLAVDVARLFQTAHEQIPGVFGATASATVDFPSAAMYVLENLLRTQLFIDVVEIYGLHVVRLETHGPVGCSLTLLVRLIFDLGLIGLIVSFATVWYNRVVRGLAVSPNAELELRAEARECGPLAPLHVRHYYREVRDFFVARMHDHEADPELFVALIAGGFLEEYRRRHPASGGGADADAIACHLGVGGLLRDRAYRRAESLIELEQAVRLLEPADAGGSRRADLLAQTDVELAYTLWYLNRHPEAEARAAAAIRARQAQGDAGRPGRGLDLAWAHYIRGVVLYSLSRPDEALVEYQAAVALYRPALDAESNPDARLDLKRKIGLALGDMGLMLEVLQRHDDSVKTHLEGIAILAESQWEHAPWAREDRATYRSNLGNTYISLNRLDEAEATYRSALHECRELERDGLLHHPRITALALVNLGHHHRRRNRLAEAAESFREAQREYELALRRGSLELRGDLCGALVGLSQCLRDLQTPAAAEEPLLGAMELYRRLVDEDGRDDLRRWLADAHFNLALLRQAQNRAADALPELEAALREYELHPRDDVSANLAEVRSHLVNALSRVGAERFQAGARTEAGGDFDRAAELTERTVDGGDWPATHSAVVLWRNQFLSLPTPQHADAPALLRHVCAGLTRWHPNRDLFGEPALAAIRQFLTEAQPLAGPARADVDRVAELYAAPPPAPTEVG